MNKTKILILAICAVVVIAGSVLGVTLLRDGIGKSDEVSTTTTTTPPETEYQFNHGFGLGSDDPNVYQPVVDNTEASDNSLATTTRLKPICPKSFTFSGVRLSIWVLACNSIGGKCMPSKPRS